MATLGGIMSMSEKDSETYDKEYLERKKNIENKYGIGDTEAKQKKRIAIAEAKRKLKTIKKLPKEQRDCRLQKEIEDEIKNLRKVK